MQQNAPLNHNKPTFAALLRIALATALLLSPFPSTFLNRSLFLNEVNVPGTIKKDAKRIQVNAPARMLYVRGIRSRCSSISIYFVCVDGMRTISGGDVRKDILTAEKAWFTVAGEGMYGRVGNSFCVDDL